MVYCERKEESKGKGVELIRPCEGFNALWRRERGGAQHLQFGILTMGLVVVQLEPVPPNHPPEDLGLPSHKSSTMGRTEYPLCDSFGMVRPQRMCELSFMWVSFRGITVGVAIN